jgi:hypothetical protein
MIRSVARIAWAIAAITAIWYAALIVFAFVVASCNPGFDPERAVCFLGGEDYGRLYHFVYWGSVSGAILVVVPVILLAVVTWCDRITSKGKNAA